MSDLREKLAAVALLHAGGSFTPEESDDEWDLAADDRVEAWRCRCGATGRLDPPAPWSEARTAIAGHRADAALAVVEQWLRDKAAKYWLLGCESDIRDIVVRLADSIAPPKGDET
jgi:hypothetical protein